MKNDVMFSIKSLVKKFDDNVVLDCINLNLYEHQSVVVLGPSGVGKSVFIKILLKLMKADCGQVFFKNRDMDKMTPQELKHFYRSIGMLFQESALFDSLPVWNNVMFGPMMNDGISDDDAKIKASELLKSVGLSDSDLLKEVSELSGGMKKRVALARAIASSPEVLFFDEPTTGLDPIMASNIIALLDKHIKNLDATAITITHDLLVAREIGERILMLDKGKIAFDGDYNELLKTKNRIVLDFLNPWRSAGMLKD